MTRGFAGEIALPVRNHPPDVELSVGNRFLLLAMCFVLAESPSGYRIALLIVWLRRDFGGSAGLGRAEWFGVC